MKNRPLMKSPPIATVYATDSAAESVARLAGRPAEQIVENMKAFKEGKAEATVMHQIAKGYSDQQIELIADYFARRPK